MKKLMQTFPSHLIRERLSREPLPFGSSRARARKTWIGLLLLTTLLLSACGGGKNNASPESPVLSGNWQFTMAPPPDGSFAGGLEGGFFLQSGSSLSGNVAYAVSLPSGATQTVCSSGSAAVTGTTSGSDVTLTAVAGTQTFTLTGTVSFNGLSMSGTYNATAGTGSGGSGCGTSQTGLQWSATLVPTLEGSIQGVIHSGGGTAGLSEQEFIVSGSLIQADNTGSSSATVTGSLNFLNALLQVSDYPCIATAPVIGQISGNSLTLHIDGADGSSVGQIGGDGLQVVTFDNTQGGYVVHSIGSPAYAVYAPECGGGSLQEPADFGNICLGLNGASGCSEPITFAPVALSFENQQAGTIAQQTVTLTNSSKSSLIDMTLGLTDDTGLGVYAETDQCGAGGSPSDGQPFTLTAGQACVITITYTPECGDSCSSTQTATLTLNSPNNDMIFTFPISGTLVPGPRAEVAPLKLRVSSLTSSLRAANLIKPQSGNRSLQDLKRHAEIE